MSENLDRLALDKLEIFNKFLDRDSDSSYVKTILDTIEALEKSPLAKSFPALKANLHVLLRQTEGYKNTTGWWILHFKEHLEGSHH